MAAASILPPSLASSLRDVGRPAEGRFRTIAVMVLVMSLVVGACAESVDGPLPDPPTPITQEELDALIATGSPTVLNVWASWCLPCRSEAPLIVTASALHPDVTFIGLNVKDRESGAQAFMAKYLADADMIHVADASGRIPVNLGAGSGVPVTFFYSTDGSLVATHRGIIDEPTFARYLDEIDR
jgi:cytochrome c biogenesis protein CcmG, thiol:disulfide interchange protein DsbE